MHYFFVSIDFQFVLKGITRLLNNPLMQTYLPNSTKKVHFHQELLVFFWKMCDYNKKFLYYVLKSSDVLEVLVPILYHLNDSRADQCKFLFSVFSLICIMLFQFNMKNVLRKIEIFDVENKCILEITSTISTLNIFEKTIQRHKY
jgi:hypothetical protein